MLLKDFHPHPGQQLVLDSPRRFIATISGVQGGKTTVGAVWFLNEVYKDYQAGLKGDYLVVAPTNKILQQSTLVKLREMIPGDWGVYKEQKMVYELKWGAKIFVRSAEDPNYLEGMTLRRVWADEAGQMKSMVWTILQARVGAQQGRIMMTSTPYAQNWYYRDVFKRAGWRNGVADPNGDPDIEIVTWGTIDNPGFPKEEVAKARTKMNQALFERRYEGKFTRLEGLVYAVSESLVVEGFTVPAEWTSFGGMDFGKSDPTAILRLREDPSTNIFYITDEFYRSNSFIKDWVEWLEGHPMKRVLADPQSAQLISEVRTSNGHGEVQPADKQEIEVGIERINSLISEGRLKIFSTCKNTIEEINTYHYDAPDPDKIVKDRPVDKDNHAMDALRYAFNKPIESVYSKRKEAIAEKRKRYIPLVTRTSWQRGLNPTTGYN